MGKVEMNRLFVLRILLVCRGYEGYRRVEGSLKMANKVVSFSGAEESRRFDLDSNFGHVGEPVTERCENADIDRRG